MCHKITRDYMYENVKKCPSHEMDTFAPRVHFSVPQDYMYVAVKKNLSHELDTFTPRVYFSVAQDYTRWQNYILLEQIIDFFIND